MEPVDGAFDSPIEEVRGFFDTTGWPNATYQIKVHATDSMDNINQTGASANLTLTCPLRMLEYEFTLAEYTKRAYTWEALGTIKNTSIDSDGVPMNLFGGDYHYHPVAIAQYALRMVDSYVISNDFAIFLSLS